MVDLLYQQNYLTWRSVPLISTVLELITPLKCPLPNWVVLQSLIFLPKLALLLDMGCSYLQMETLGSLCLSRAVHTGICHWHSGCDFLVGVVTLLCNVITPLDI